MRAVRAVRGVHPHPSHPHCGQQLRHVLQGDDDDDNDDDDDDDDDDAHVSCVIEIMIMM